jgi:host factor-I protein
MQKSTNNIQDIFLNNIRKENIAMTMFLINGFQIKGYVKGFDNFTVVIESEGKQHMVYKHAISTIVPVQTVAFQVHPGGNGEHADDK